MTRPLRIEYLGAWLLLNNYDNSKWAKQRSAPRRWPAIFFCDTISYTTHRRAWFVV